MEHSEPTQYINKTTMNWSSAIKQRSRLLTTQIKGTDPIRVEQLTLILVLKISQLRRQCFQPQAVFMPKLSKETISSTILSDSYSSKSHLKKFNKFVKNWRITRKMTK